MELLGLGETLALVVSWRIALVWEAIAVVCPEDIDASCNLDGQLVVIHSASAAIVPNNRVKVCTVDEDGHAGDVHAIPH